MNDTLVNLSGALGGAVLGGLLGAFGTYVVSTRLLRKQANQQQRYERWIRLLNSYQSFPNFARQSIAFRTKGPIELWPGTLQEIYKAAFDAEVLDPYGQEQRIPLMREIIDRLHTDQPLGDSDVIDVEHRLQMLHESFSNDQRLTDLQFSKRRSFNTDPGNSHGHRRGWEFRVSFRARQ